MARGKKFGRLANRPLSRIEDKADERAREIAEFIVEWIHVNGPYDEHRPPSHTGVHLKDSYYARRDPATGDYLISSRRRYWAFVEFGTRRSRKRMHVRPAIQAAKREYGR